jgi:hypothetical protein
MRLPVPDATSEQSRKAHTDKGSAHNTLFPGADRVELSPEARELAQQNSASGIFPADPRSETEANSSTSKTNEEEAARAHISGRANRDSDEESETEETSENSEPGIRGGNIPPEEQQEVQELKRRDQEVRTHEAAHATVGGQYAGAPSLEYETGPDGKRYAVSGEVDIDLSEVKGDPQETIDKMEQIQAAALAPAQPSAQDRRVAARAAQIATQARMDLRSQQDEPGNTYAAAPAGVSSGESDETRQQTPSASIPAISIESLRWSGAVA